MSKDQDLSYKEKCKMLEARINDVNGYNESMAVEISRKKAAIKRLKMEYAILLERLEIKTLSKKTSLSTIAALYSTPPSGNDPNTDDTQQDQYLIPKSPSLPPLNMLELNARLAPLIRLDDLLLNKQPIAVPARSRGGRPASTNSGPHFTILPNMGAPVKRRGNYKHGKNTIAKKKERDPNLPKRPTNSYLIFCELEKEKLKEKLDKESPPGYMYDMSKALTEAWKNLNEQQKKPYYKLYEEDKKRYTEELRVYNEKKAADAAIAEANSPDGKAGIADSSESVESSIEKSRTASNKTSGGQGKVSIANDVRTKSKNSNGVVKKEITMIDVDAESEEETEENGKEDEEDAGNEEEDVEDEDGEEEGAGGHDDYEEDDDGESSVLNTDMHDEDDEEDNDSILHTDGHDDEELATENGAEDEDSEIDVDDDESDDEVDDETNDQEQHVHTVKKRTYIDVDDEDDDDDEDEDDDGEEPDSKKLLP